MTPRRRRRLSRPARWVFAVAVLLLVAGGAWMAGREKAPPPPAPGAPAQAPAEVAPPPAAPPPTEAPKTSPAPQSIRETPISEPRVAFIAPLSGLFEREGKSLRTGVEMAFEELRGRGLKAQLTVIDGAVEPEGFLKTAEELAGDPSVALVLAHLPVALLSPVIPIFEESGLPLVVLSNSHESLTNHPFVVSFMPSDRTEGVFAARVAARWAGGAEVAVVEEPGAYGEMLRGGFQEEAARSGLSVRVIPCDASGAGASGAAEAVRAARAPVVWLAGTPHWGIAVARALAEKKFSGQVLAPHTYEASFLDDLLGDPGPRFHVLRPRIAPGEDGEAGKFRARFRELAWREADGFSALGHDAMRWTGEALLSGPLSRQGLRDALFSWNTPEKAWQGISGPVYVSPKGDVPRAFQVTVYRQGRLVPAPQ